MGTTINNAKIKWEIFQELGSRFGKKAISITENFGFGFSSGVCQEFHLSKFTHVLLRYAKDNSHHFIGFQLTRDRNQIGAVQLTQKKNFAQIGVRSYFKKYNLDPVILKGSYPIEKADDQDGGLIIFIRVPIQPIKAAVPAF